MECNGSIAQNGCNRLQNVFMLLMQQNANVMARMEARLIHERWVSNCWPDVISEMDAWRAYTTMERFVTFVVYIV